MVKSEKITREEQNDEATETKKVSRGVSANILWGGLFLLAGLLLLLSNLGLLNVRWEEAWRLWPILIIIAGLSILSLRGWVAALVYGTTAVVIVALVWATLMGAISPTNHINETETFDISKEGEDIKNLALTIEGGAGSLHVASTSTGSVAEGESTGNHVQFDTNVTSNGDKQTVKITQNHDGMGWMMPGSVNNLDIRLNKDLPTDLEVRAGASSIDADLSDIKLQSLLLDSGASSIDLKLGDKMTTSKATIKTGVSSVTVRVPKNSGIKLMLDAGLSSKSLPDGYRQEDGNTFLSSNYDSAGKKITIDVDIGVSSFKLETY